MKYYIEGVIQNFKISLGVLLREAPSPSTLTALLSAGPCNQMRQQEDHLKYVALQLSSIRAHPARWRGTKVSRVICRLRPRARPVVRKQDIDKPVRLLRHNRMILPNDLCRT